MVDEKNLSGNIKQCSFNDYPLLWFDMIIYSLRSPLDDVNDFALSHKKRYLILFASVLTHSLLLPSSLSVCVCVYNLTCNEWDKTLSYKN